MEGNLFEKFSFLTFDDGRRDGYFNTSERSFDRQYKEGFMRGQMDRIFEEEKKRQDELDKNIEKIKDRHRF